MLFMVGREERSLVAPLLLRALYGGKQVQFAHNRQANYRPHTFVALTTIGYTTGMTIE